MTHEEFENLAALDAIGASTEEEGASLRQHLETCEACVAVAREYEEAATLMARSLDPAVPPAGVREQILAAVREAPPADDLADTTLVSWRSRRMKPVWWLATAATFFLALWGWAELRVRTVRTELQELHAVRKALEEHNRQLTRQSESLAGTLEALTASQTRTISLTGQEVAPGASARVFLDSQGRRAFVFFYDLPPNPGDKSYQLWIIRADSPQPQPAGTFNVDPSGKAELSVENLPVGKELKALAVTLEPRGGVAAPTGAMYLIGKSS